MDPITLVISAVALGASAGLKDAAAQVVKDSYALLKGLLTRRGVDVSGVEKKPDSDNRKGTLREDLEDLADSEHALDDEVLAAARAVTDAVAAQDPAAAAAAGVDLERVKAAFLTVQSVVSTGTGVRVRDGEFSGGIDIGQVSAGVDVGDRGDPSGR